MSLMSEDLMPIFSEVIAVRFRCNREKQVRDDLPDTWLGEQMLGVLSTLGDVARTANATHASVCCTNEWRRWYRVAKGWDTALFV